MFVPRPGSPQPVPRLAALLLLAFLVVLAASRAAQADRTLLEGVDAPIVRVSVRSGNVIIRTWNRASVAIDGDPGLIVDRTATIQPDEPSALLIPRVQARTSDAVAALAPESFVVSSIPGGPRDQIVVRSAALEPGGTPPATPLTVTVPSDAVYVGVRTGRGDLEVRDYRTGTLVVFAGSGRVLLAGVGGTVFAQTSRGALTARDSAFERLRARSLFGNVVLQRCSARQIEVTSVAGSIVDDAGSFKPGLARFESMQGNIALGAAGAAEVAARAGAGGRVYVHFSAATRVENRGGQSFALVSGGGPLVTATSEAGSIFLYDGTLRAHGRGLPAEWRVPLALLRKPGDDVRPPDSRDPRTRPNSRLTPLLFGRPSAKPDVRPAPQQRLE